MLCFSSPKPKINYLHIRKPAAGACHKVSHVSVFEHTGSSAQMCGSCLCCRLGNTLSTDGFRAPLLCGLFFTASQPAAAGDAEAPQKQDNHPHHQGKSTDTCDIQASARESWQRHWILAAGQADPGMYLGGGIAIVGWKRRNCGKLSLWSHSSQRPKLVSHKVGITAPQSSKCAREWLDTDQCILFWQNSNRGHKLW